MTVYKHKVGGNYLYDFRYMGRRYAGRTFARDKESARLYEAELKLQVRPRGARRHPRTARSGGSCSEPASESPCNWIPESRC
jgi:hypothetical protein